MGTPGTQVSWGTVAAVGLLPHFPCEGYGNKRCKKKFFRIKMKNLDLGKTLTWEIPGDLSMEPTVRSLRLGSEPQGCV